MLSNTLTRDMGFKVGPLVLETLIKHYFDRVKTRDSTDSNTPLRQDKILYDEAFNIIKPYSGGTARLLKYLNPNFTMDAHSLGGEDVARDVVGGTKWWQVRGVEGVVAEWLTAKKDWREAKRLHKQRVNESINGQTPPSSTQPPVEQSKKSAAEENGTYKKYMDEMRCILYIHGGGYYFGSVDQSRYSIQRHARKINGRVFAINYRLAPQYPFPCGLQDALASYIYLIHPPPGADHRPINPAHIVIAGDSAGGGMALALLQVIRDSGLPAPAGGVLISPWCDLTHSFPSIHTNTETDVIPPSGLSFHKPSILWPPPPPDVSARIHASLRQKLRQTFRMDYHSSKPHLKHDHKSMESHRKSIESLRDHNVAPVPVDVGENTSVPALHSVDPQKIVMVTGSGEKLEVDRQVQLYTENSLLVHPLVSPGLSYLGGLPPMLFIVSDKEVLRDEIIYTAHKAANPAKFPVKEQTKALYPLLRGIEERHPKPSCVHLQVYDDTAHILPVLFAFSTPAKYCFRSMALFCKLVTGMSLYASSLPNSLMIPKADKFESPLEGIQCTSPAPTEVVEPTLSAEGRVSTENTQNYTSTTLFPTPPSSRKPSLRRTLSAHVSRTNSFIRRQPAPPTLKQEIVKEEEVTVSAEVTVKEDSLASSDVGGSRFGRKSTMKKAKNQEPHAGEPRVYDDIKDRTTWNMIRERVSTQGVIRPLEPEAELNAFKVPEDIIGNVSELAIRRYLRTDAVFQKKFSRTVKSIEKERKRHLERAKRETTRRLDAIAESLYWGKEKKNSPRINESIVTSPGWGYAWALDENERPPPSSIVARRDTEEARKLAEIADQAILEDGGTMNANSLWSVVMNFLTVTPDTKSTLRVGSMSRSRSRSRIRARGDDTPKVETHEVEQVEEVRSGSRFWSWRLHKQESTHISSSH